MRPDIQHNNQFLTFNKELLLSHKHMWKEFKGNWVWADGKKVLKIEEKNIIPIGKSLVITKETTGLFKKKVVCETSVKILSEDKVQITKRRPLETSVTNGGNVHGAGMALQSYNFEGAQTVPEETVVYERGHVWEDSGNHVHGVLYVDQNGNQPKALLITPKRTFYEGDKDEKALEMFERFKIR